MPGKVPTFIGIGPQKAGTTWLDAVLRRHDEICLPADRKEVFFYDKYYERGRDWYEGLFANCGESKAIGEVTPTYFAKPHVLRRIADDYPDIKLIVILRHPVDRLISHYGMFVENGSQAQDVMQAVDMHEALHRNSNYSQYLPVLFQLFSPDQIHIMIYEELFANEQARKEHLCALAHFLGVNPQQLSECDITDKVRQTRGPPKNRWFFQVAMRLRKFVMRHDMEWVISLAKRLGIRREHFLRRKLRGKGISHDKRKKLNHMLAADIEAAEQYLGRNIDIWHDTGTKN